MFGLKKLKAQAAVPEQGADLEEQLIAACAERDLQQEEVERKSRVIERLRNQARRNEKELDALREENKALDQALRDMRAEYLRRLASLETL